MVPVASRFAWMGLFALLLSACPLAKARAASLTPPTQVTTTGGGNPTVSPDGAWVAYQTLGSLRRIRLSDAKVETLLVGTYWEPDWSGTNGLILVNSDVPSGLFTFDPVAKDLQLVISRGAGYEENAVWSPLGDGIAARSTSPDGLVFITYPGGVSSAIACLEPDQTSCSGEDPTWSPDGQWIAFYDGPIEKVRPAGGQAEYITQPSEGGYWPSWSPDGKWIAFAKPNLGETEDHIWVADARGPSFGQTQVTDGPSYDGHPTWSPQSDAIYFDSDRSGPIEIWRVPFDPAVPALRVTWGKLKAMHR